MNSYVILVCCCQMSNLSLCVVRYRFVLAVINFDQRTVDSCNCDPVVAISVDNLHIWAFNTLEAQISSKNGRLKAHFIAKLTP